MTQLNSKRILLVQPLGYPSDAAGRDIARIANIMPPLGIACIASFLHTRGFEARIVDCNANLRSEARITELLREWKPAFIGMSCATANFLDGVRLAGMAKAELPGIRTVFGGHHVSALGAEMVDRFPVIDYAVVGEGEETLAELLDHGGEDGSTIKGLVYRDGEGRALFAGPRAPAPSLDAFPFPAYEKLEGYPSAYKLPIFNYPAAPNSSCSSSRGCPYHCAYCDRSVFPGGYRSNSAEYLYEHVKYLKECFGIRHINFYDDQFTLLRKRVSEFAAMMIDKPLGVTFNCAVRAEHIDLPVLSLMKSAGCWMISLGIETGDRELLARHRTKADLSLVAEKVRLVRKAGIRVKGLMMIGLPGETEESVKKSMDFAFSLPLNDLNISKFTPFPGSPLYENIGGLGTFDEDWNKMDCMHFQFVPEGMTRERLEELFTLFYKGYFLRPRILLGYASMMWRSPDSWKRFLSNLSDFLTFARTDKRLGPVRGARKG